MRRELLLLGLLLVIGAGLKAGEMHYESISHRILETPPQSSTVPTPSTPSTVTVVSFPDGHELYNVSIAEHVTGSESLSAIYFSPLNAARAEALATISMTLDYIHASQLLIALLSLYIFLRIENSRLRMPPSFV